MFWLAWKVADKVKEEIERLSSILDSGLDRYKDDCLRWFERWGRF